MIARFDPAVLPPDAVEVAGVVDAWGVKGWLKLKPHSPEPQALYSSKRWYLIPKSDPLQPEPGPVRVSVRQVREHSDMVVALLEGVDDRSAAEALRGARILVPRSSFPTPGADEYYWVDLLGLQVMNREGIELGRVVALHPTGPHSVLVLEYPSATGEPAQRMIPFVAAFVDSVSLQERTIMVDWQPDY